MFMPHLADRYAATMYVGFGHPFGGDLFTATTGLLCSANVETPLVMKMSLGLDD